VSSNGCLLVKVLVLRVLFFPQTPKPNSYIKHQLLQKKKKTNTNHIILGRDKLADGWWNKSRSLFWEKCIPAISWSRKYHTTRSHHICLQNM